MSEAFIACQEQFQSFQDSLAAALQVIRDRETALKEREAELHMKEVSLEETKEEQQSFQKVSLYNKLLKDIDQLKTENRLLKRSQELRARQAEEKLCPKSDETVVEIEVTDEDSPDPTDPTKHNSDANDDADVEDDGEQKEDDDEDEELDTIKVKGLTYSTDGDYLYDIETGDAIAYKKGDHFRFYKKKKGNVVEC